MARWKRDVQNRQIRSGEDSSRDRIVRELGECRPSDFQTEKFSTALRERTFANRLSGSLYFSFDELHRPFPHPLVIRA